MESRGAWTNCKLECLWDQIGVEVRSGTGWARQLGIHFPQPDRWLLETPYSHRYNSKMDPKIDRKGSLLHITYCTLSRLLPLSPFAFPLSSFAVVVPRGRELRETSRITSRRSRVGERGARTGEQKLFGKLSHELSGERFLGTLCQVRYYKDPHTK